MKLTPDHLLKGLAALCALLALADFIVHRHAYSDLEATPLFFAVLGFAALIVIAGASRLLQKLITRPADYYDQQGGPHE